MQLLYNPIISLSGNLFQINENLCLYKHLHMNVHNCLICDTPKLEATQKFFNE